MNHEVSPEEYQNHQWLEQSRPPLSVKKIQHRTVQWAVHTICLGILWDHNEREHQARLEQQLDAQRYESYINIKSNGARVNPWHVWFPGHWNEEKTVQADNKTKDLQEDSVLRDIDSDSAAMIGKALQQLIDVRQEVKTAKGNVLGEFWKHPVRWDQEGVEPRQKERTYETSQPVEEQDMVNLEVVLEQALSGLKEDQKEHYKACVTSLVEYIQKSSNILGLSASRIDEKKFVHEDGAFEQSQNMSVGRSIVHVDTFANPIASYPLLELSDKEWSMCLSTMCPIFLSKWLYADGSDHWYAMHEKNASEKMSLTEVPGSTPTQRALNRLIHAVHATYWLGAIDNTLLNRHERFLNRLFRRKDYERSALMEQVTSDVYFEQAGRWSYGVWEAKQTPKTPTVEVEGVQKVGEKEERKTKKRHWLSKQEKNNAKTLGQLMQQIQGMRTKERDKTLTISGILMVSSVGNAFSGLLGMHAKALLSTVVHPALLAVAVPYLGYKMWTQDKPKNHQIHRDMGEYLSQVYDTQMPMPLVHSMSRWMALLRNQEEFNLIEKMRYGSARGQVLLRMYSQCPSPKALMHWWSNPSSCTYEQGVERMVKENAKSAAWCAKNGASLSVSVLLARSIEMHSQKVLDPKALQGTTEGQDADIPWLSEQWEHWIQLLPNEDHGARVLKEKVQSALNAAHIPGAFKSMGEDEKAYQKQKQRGSSEPIGEWVSKEQYGWQSTVLEYVTSVGGVKKRALDKTLRL